MNRTNFCPCRWTLGLRNVQYFLLLSLVILSQLGMSEADSIKDLTEEGTEIEPNAPVELLSGTGTTELRNQTSNIAIPDKYNATSANVTSNLSSESSNDAEANADEGSTNVDPFSVDDPDVTVKTEEAEEIESVDTENNGEQELTEGEEELTEPEDPDEATALPSLNIGSSTSSTVNTDSTSTLIADSTLPEATDSEVNADEENLVGSNIDGPRRAPERKFNATEAVPGAEVELPADTGIDEENEENFEGTAPSAAEISSTTKLDSELLPDLAAGEGTATDIPEDSPPTNEEQKTTNSEGIELESELTAENANSELEPVSGTELSLKKIQTPPLPATSSSTTDIWKAVEPTTKLRDISAGTVVAPESSDSVSTAETDDATNTENIFVGDGSIFGSQPTITGGSSPPTAAENEATISEEVENKATIAEEVPFATDLVPPTSVSAISTTTTNTDFGFPSPGLLPTGENTELEIETATEATITAVEGITGEEDSSNIEEGGVKILASSESTNVEISGSATPKFQPTTTTIPQPFQFSGTWDFASQVTKTSSGLGTPTETVSTGDKTVIIEPTGTLEGAEATPVTSNEAASEVTNTDALSEEVSSTISEDSDLSSSAHPELSAPTPEPEPETVPVVTFSENPETTAEAEPTTSAEPSAEPETVKSTETITTTEKSPIKLHAMTLSMKLADLQWNSSFADKSTGAYNKLEEQILPHLKRMLTNIIGPIFSDVKIVSLRKGSVIVDGKILTTEKFLEPEVLATRLEEEIASANSLLGGNRVDRRTIIIDGYISRNLVEGNGSREEYSKGSSDTPGYIIGTVIALLLLTTLLIVFGCVACNQKRTSRSLRLREDAYAVEGGGGLGAKTWQQGSAPDASHMYAGVNLYEMRDIADDFHSPDARIPVTKTTETGS